MTEMAAVGTSTETRQAIGETAYSALYRHGAADFTMQALAVESKRTQAVRHYNHQSDSSAQLFVTSLVPLFGRFRKWLRRPDAE